MLLHYTILIFNDQFNMSLPLSQTHSDLHSEESIHSFMPYVSFTGFAFYIAVRCGFTTVR